MSSSFPAIRQVSPAEPAANGERSGKAANVAGKGAGNVSRKTADDQGVSDERDAQLVRRAQAGDQQAWARLYQDHFDRAYRYLLYLLGDSDIAEDLTQETFARALVSLKKFRGDASVQTWINRIGVNVAREHWRGQKRRGRIRESSKQIAEMGDQGEVLHHHYVDEVRSRVLYEVLEELPTHLREAFVLRDLIGHDAKEAAATLGISAGNLAVRAHRARKKVQARLDEMGWLEHSGAARDEGEDDDG